MGSSGKKAIRKIGKNVGLAPDAPKAPKAAPRTQAPVIPEAATALGAAGAGQAQFRRQAGASMGSGTMLTDVFGLGDDARKRRKTLLGE